MMKHTLQFLIAICLCSVLLFSRILSTEIASGIQPVLAQPALSAGSYPVYLPVMQKEPDWWRPAPGLSFQWQLTTPTRVLADARVYDVDLVDTPLDTITQLHTRGAVVICYISVGSWEDWRPDASKYPSQVLGKDYAGWPGEKWLDIRRIDLLSPILTARLDLCKQKGFDAVEPDNINNFQQDTGFPLTYADQLRFNRWLADAAHARGLSIGLKNDTDQIADLLSYYDWALQEDCFYWKECATLKPFIDAGKAVFQTEYTDTGVQASAFCPQAAQYRFTAILKHRSLDDYRVACPLP